MTDQYAMERFCCEIALPSEVLSEVLHIYAETDLKQYEFFIEGLLHPQRSFDSFMKLAGELNEDARQMKMLTIQLECARRCLERYEKKGIDKSIFLDTMSCFTRFVGEFYNKNGYYGFDCPWWSYRQLNMTLFRIGALEFEFEINENGKTINIHIPSNAPFRLVDIRDSVVRCKAFTAKFYPDFTAVPLTCHSWLLSPKLTPLLGEDSNILRFQKLFSVTRTFEEEKQYIGFIFGANADTPVGQLKEETSLQRKVKALLKQNVDLGAAYGILNEDAL